MIGLLFATPIDWQAGLAWFAIMTLVLGGIAVLLGLVVIVIRSMFFPPSDDDLDERT